MKEGMVKEIADLKKPTVNESYQYDDSEKLFSDKEFKKYMEENEKDFVWNNYFEEVEKGKQYRGQWSKDRKKW